MPEKVALLSCYDKFRHERSVNKGHMYSTDILFVCVPTPTKQLKQQQGALFEVLDDLATASYQGVVVVKSTVLPGTMDKLRENFPALRLVHNPEFLTERFASDNYREESTWLLSGDPVDIDTVWAFLQATTAAKTLYMSPHYRATEFAKYLHNCMLAVKLSFLNEVYDVVGDHEIFEMAVAMASPFGNLGSHTRVPGPDGKRGWGGMCFPKDTMAFLGAFEKDLPTLRGAVNTNTKLRPKEMSL